MTLKVGEQYRGHFAGSIHWFGIAAIEQIASGDTRIRSCVTRKHWPRFIWRAFGIRKAESATDFVQRLDRAAAADAEAAKAEDQSRVVKRHREVEVRYK